MTVLAPRGRPRAIAHRGDPVGHRENTLAAVAAALRAGADLVEVDVKVTADGAVVLLHDATLHRLWGDPAPVAALTRADLAARGHAAVPLLADALALVAGSGASLLVDMDADGLAVPALRVVDALVAAGDLDRAEVAWCGRLGALDAVRAADPAARILLSWEAPQPPADDVVDRLTPEAFNPCWTGVGAATAAWAHRRGMALSCWTVDDDRLMGTLLDRGVDAVISNRIGALRAVLDARG